MNLRMRNLKKYFEFISSGGEKLWYTWYINDNNTVTTEFYFGPMPKTKLQDTISGKPVTVLGCTTYTHDTNVAIVELPNTLTEIE